MAIGRPSWATAVLVALLLWVPLPFASVTPLALLAARAGALVVFAMAMWSDRQRSRPSGLSIPVAALFAVAAIGLVQALPLPSEWLERLSPERLRLATEASTLSGTPLESIPLSLAPERTLSTALTIAVLALLLVAANRLGRSRVDRRWILGTIGAAALFQLLYGLRHLAAGSIAVWGLDVGRDPTRLRGTFVNPAHLGPYLEMALALAFGAAWWGLSRVRWERLRPEVRLAAGIGPVLGWLLLFAGLALTGSRAALAAAALATFVQGLALAAYHRRWRLVPVGLVMLVVGLGLVAWTGLERGLGRLLGTSVHSVTASARVEVWSGTLELWQRFPFFGTGLGTFEAAFPMVESEAVASVGWVHAHNDWVELLATGGLFASLALMVGAVAIGVRLGRRLLRAGDPEAAAVALAGLGAFVAVGLHELLDFGLTLPANSWTLAVLLGVAAADETGSESEPESE